MQNSFPFYLDGKNYKKSWTGYKCWSYNSFLYKTGIVKDKFLRTGGFHKHCKPTLEMARVLSRFVSESQSVLEVSSLSLERTEYSSNSFYFFNWAPCWVQKWSVPERWRHLLLGITHTIWHTKLYIYRWEEAIGISYAYGRSFHLSVHWCRAFKFRCKFILKELFPHYASWDKCASAYKILHNGQRRI